MNRETHNKFRDRRTNDCAMSIERWFYRQENVRFPFGHVFELFTCTELWSLDPPWNFPAWRVDPMENSVAFETNSLLLNYWRSAVVTLDWRNPRASDRERNVRIFCFDFSIDCGRTSEVYRRPIRCSPTERKSAVRSLLITLNHWSLIGLRSLYRWLDEEISA